MSTNTFLIDCNRQQSVEVESSNESNAAIWTSKISEGLQLDPGDRVSLSSAFINEVGSGAQTIDFTDDFVETGVTENSLSVTVQFYKCADGENCLILPRKWCWGTAATPDTAGQTAATQNTDEVASLPIKYNDPPDVADYEPSYRRVHDGQRYTIMKGTYIAGLQRTEYDLHTDTVPLSVKTGYSTSDNICQELTQQLHQTTDPSSSDNTITMTSSLFKPFVCANVDNFSETAYSGASKWNPYDFVGIHDPELYLAGKLPATNVLRSTADRVTINLEYTSDFLTEFKALFAEQERRSDLIFGAGISTSNTRFLHVNATLNSAAHQFGSDIDLNDGSCRLFVKFDPSLSESEADGYGFGTNDGGYIRFELTGDKLHAGITQQPGHGDGPLGTRCIGFDTHFSAYGVDAVLLWSGYKEKTYDKKVWQGGTTVSSIYLGAINPSVVFDTTQSRFVVSQLHTSRQQINTAKAGSDPKKIVYPINPDAGKDVFQINPQYNHNNIASRTMAYNPEVRLTAHAGTTPASNLLKTWTVFDSKSGVFVSDWGLSKTNWSKGLWGKLGYRYTDLNPSGATNRNGRSTTSSPGSNPLTTNADVNTTQAMSFAINPYGAPQYTLQLPLTTTTQLSTITVFATSTELAASDLAMQEHDGYWLVRSSIIDNSMFLNARGLSPVIAVIDRSYSSRDFIYMGESTVDFLITKSRTLTDIVTSLHLPDGSYASVDGRSAVIYRIVKANNVPLSIVDSFLGKKTASK